MNEKEKNEFDFRKEKIENMRKNGDNPYKSKFDKTHSIKQALELKEKKLEDLLKDKNGNVKICGRIKSFRSHGNLTFCDIEDFTGKIQIAFMKNALGKEKYDYAKENIAVADFLGLSGEIFLTKKGQISILAFDFKILSKALRPLPEKFHGIKDKDKIYRQIYLALASDKNLREKFVFRSKLISFVRSFLEKKDFLEIETAILSKHASGALAKPFSTHYDALDTDFFLRIALETPQKKLLAGGFEKIFEIGKVFRNEGMDPSHLQEFTMIEFYEAYADFNKLKKITEDLFHGLFKQLIKKEEIEIIDSEGKNLKINIKNKFEEIKMKDLIKKDTGIDYEKFETAKKLKNEIVKKNIEIKDCEKMSRGNLIDQLYKKKSRNKIKLPTFITNHPIDLSPLSRKTDEEENTCDRFQLVIGGHEIVNAYSELVDPIDQKNRFEAQAKDKEKGDKEAHENDEDFLLAMEHGFPPCAGWGMGIDRLVALLTKSENLRDVIFFPSMK